MIGALLVLMLVAGVSSTEYNLNLTGIHVQGNQFVNAAGQTVVLRVSGDSIIIRFYLFFIEFSLYVSGHGSFRFRVCLRARMGIFRWPL